MAKLSLTKGANMATQNVQLVVALTIHDGKFDAFERVAKEMVAGSKIEPGTLIYEMCLSTDRRRCRVVETYRDSQALLTHFNGPVVQQMMPQLLESSAIERFEVYGTPDFDAAALLAGFGAEIFSYWRGVS